MAYPGIPGEQAPGLAPPGPARYPPQPGFGTALPGVSPKAGVERYELAPVQAADGSGLPQDLWRSVDLKTAEQMLAAAPLPPLSPALARLFRRALTSSAADPMGGQAPNHWKALRLEALYRSGFISDMHPLLQNAGDDPLLSAFAVRAALANGKSADVCAATRALLQRRAELPAQMRGEVQLLSGYCAAADGNRPAAGMAATLARDEGIDAPLAIGALEAIAGDGKTGMPAPKNVHVLDYRLLEQMGPVEPAQILERAEPALLAALATTATDPKLRVAAAELASIAGVVDAKVLASAYRVATDANDAVFRRANLFRSAVAEGAPARKLAAARALLDETRKSPLYLTAAAALDDVLDGTQPGPETLANGDAAIEVALAAGKPEIARRWAEASPALRHWLALIDLADPAVPPQVREADLAALEDVVRRNRFSPIALHRLATVLDATDVNVPIPLWEAASRTPQPATGRLPETGALPQLADAAKKKEVGRTLLIALRGLGGQATGAHIIALGDTIRALRRAGLDRDARQIAVEALLADWPPGGGA